MDVEDDFAAAADHFGKAVQLFRIGGFDCDGLDGYRSKMAFMHAMQSAHTSLEGGLSRILDMLGEELPTGTHWHEKLVTRVSKQTADRPAILSAQTALLADETRRFRNVETRNYNNFRADEAGKAVAAAETLSICIMTELHVFKDAIDPPVCSKCGAIPCICDEGGTPPVPGM